MNKLKIKAIVFDIGGVLFLPKSKKPKHHLNSFKAALSLTSLMDISNEKLFKSLLKIYFKSTDGEISKKETLKKLSQKLNISGRLIRRAFRRSYKDNVIENKVLVSFAKKIYNLGYKLGILSIQWHLSKDILVPKKFYSIFDGLVISCDDKIRKPKIKSFKLIFKRLGIKAGEGILVDDDEKILEVAKKLGMKTVLFKNNIQTIKEIKELLK